MKKASKALVLIVEDSFQCRNDWKEDLKNKVKILEADNIIEARRKFKHHKNISLIVMDACVPGDVPNTDSLVREFRETFTGPIIATTSVPHYMEILVNAGCSHQASKESVPCLVLKILGIA